MELLLAYCAGERNTPETASLERHIVSCAACRDLVASQQLVWSALEEWKAPEVSPGFNRELFARIDQQVSWRERLLRPFRPLWIRLAVPLAAAACLVITAGVVMDHRLTLSQETPVEAAQPEQIEHELDDMQMLHDFNLAMPADAANEKM